MANKLITQLPAAGPITGSELVPIQQGSLTVQATVNQLVATPSQFQTFLTVNNEPTLPNSRYVGTGIGIGISDTGAQGKLSLYLNGTSGSLEVSGYGILAKTSANTVTARAFTVSGAGLNIANGDGISGNPVLTVTGLLYSLANLSGTGLVASNGSSLTPLSILGTLNQINIANGNGLGGNPTVSISNNALFPGLAGVTVPNGTTAQRPISPNQGQIRYNTDTASLEAYTNSAWGAIVAGSGLTTFNAGATGLTPNTPTTGGIILGGIVNTASGGTGISTTPANGALLIGNGAGYTSATLTAGSNISIVNTAGAITITANSTGATTYLGTWNANINTPTLVSGTGLSGGYYIVSVAGTTNLNGISLWSVGDWAVFNGTVWQKVLGSSTESFNSITVTSLTGYMYANGTGSVTSSTTIPTTSLSGTVTNAQLANSSVTINGNSVPLGSSTTVTASTTSALTISTGLSGASFNGSAPVTIALANTTVTAGSYGSVSNTLLATVNAQGQLTALSASPISIANTQVSGLGTMSTQNANSVAVTGGTINGTSVGATTRSSGDFTTLSANTVTSTTPVLSFNASNTIASFGSTTASSYNQLVIQNKSTSASASTNYVLSNDLGTDSAYYGEFGMNSSTYSASTPIDFFSLNNGVYFSGHDGDITVGSGNGFKHYMAWGTSGQSAHVINATGALGFSTNLGTTPALSGTTGFGTSGQALISAGSASAPVWGTLSVSGGGTGLTSFTANQIHYGTFSQSANLTFNGSALSVTGSGTFTTGVGGGNF